MARAYLSIGSNLGDRRKLCHQALHALQCSPGIRVLAISGDYETEPVDKTDQPEFINLAVELETELPADVLLETCKRIEKDLGRVPTERFGPRSIDLDLLLLGQQRIEDPRLVVPHPRMHLRRFVLAPLSEIASQAVHPGLGKTVSQLLKALGDGGGSVRRLDSHAAGRKNPTSTTEEDSQ